MASAVGTILSRDRFVAGRLRRPTHAGPLTGISVRDHPLRDEACGKPAL